MATLTVRQAITVDGNVVEGSITANVSLGLTVGSAYCAKDIVIADNYGEDSLWTTTEGGLDTFSHGFIYSDKDIWVQLRNDDSGAVEYIRLFIPATVLAFIPGKVAGNTTDAFDGAILVDNTDFADVDKIEVTRDVADAVGDATVSLYLFA